MRADYAVSANIGRTLDACRQAVIDVRCCLDWLESQGLSPSGHPGHQPRVLLCLSWPPPTIRESAWQLSIMPPPTSPMSCGTDNPLATFAKDWNHRSISNGCAFCGAPSAPFPTSSSSARWRKKSLIIYAKYDLTFLPEFSRSAVDEFARHGLDHKVVVLPCGHYTTGETPYKYMDGWHLVSFMRTAFEG